METDGHWDCSSFREMREIGAGWTISRTDLGCNISRYVGPASAEGRQDYDAFGEMKEVGMG